MHEHILLVGASSALPGPVGDDLTQRGYGVETALDIAGTERILAQKAPDLILIDHPCPQSLDKGVVKRWASRYPVLLLLSGETDQEDLLRVMRLGVAEFLVKPVDVEELACAVRRIIDNAVLYQSGEFYTHVMRQEAPSLLIGDSAGLGNLLMSLRAVAPTDATVLILGESGVGKEKVAQEIHRLSARMAQPLIAVDCCSLQETLFESELFGHERGAFTGAVQRKPGLIEQARGGTVFLDEIGEIPAAIQAKLLRVLESRRFRRVGGNEDLAADVRIVAATNRDLAAMARRGEFRQDLLYRLNAFVVEVPPLRERREDILPIARHFLTHSSFASRIAKRLSEEAQASLLDYHWPGNVRELRNVIERSIILSGNKLRIDREHLTLPVSPGQAAKQADITLTFDHEPSLMEIERRYLQLILDRHHGHRATVARVLGVGERTLYRMIAQHKLGSGHDPA